MLILGIVLDTLGERSPLATIAAISLPILLLVVCETVITHNLTRMQGKAALKTNQNDDDNDDDDDEKQNRVTEKAKLVNDEKSPLL